MKTMADGAAQRLVAEMGQILFGQPGLTLMELAEKVKSSRSLLSNSDVLEVVARYVGKTSAAYRYIAEDLATRHAANMDDAQPSPAGQGDALPPLPAMGYEVRGTGMGPHDVYYTPAAYTAEQMQDYARTALATRQPGASNQLSGNSGELDVDGARQPVGQEPVDYIEFLDSQNDSLRRAIHAIMAKLVFLLDEDQFADVDAIALAAGVSPPPQAGDLGK